MNEIVEELPNLMVFDIDNTKFDLIGVLERYESVQVTFNSDSYGDMTVTAPVTDINLELLQEGNVVYFSERRAAIITQVRRERNKDNVLMIEAKGYSIVFLLSWRCVKDAIQLEGLTVFNAACQIYWNNFPQTGNRRMPWFDHSVYSQVSAATDRAKIDTVSDVIEVTDVYEALSEFATTYDLNVELRMYPRESLFRFYFGSGVDRTLGNALGTAPVVLSADTQDLLESVYEYSNFDYVNYAYIKGEENDDGNIFTDLGDNAAAGWERRELYVDASGVSSTTDGDDGDPHTVDEDEYILMLKEEGAAQIAERNAVETYEATLNQVGDHRYKLDQDFYLGDKVTIVDTDLGVQLDARLTSVDYVYGKNKNEKVLHFGYDNMKRLGDVFKRRW